MNKCLKKTLIISASLLMFLSTGIGINNVNARRYHYRYYRHYRYNYRKMHTRHKRKRTKRTYRKHVPSFRISVKGYSAPITDHTKTANHYYVYFKPTKADRTPVMDIHNLNLRKRTILKKMNYDDNDPFVLPINRSTYEFNPNAVTSWNSSMEVPIDSESGNDYSVFSTKGCSKRARKNLEKIVMNGKPILKGYFRDKMYAPLTHKAWINEIRNGIFYDINNDRTNNDVSSLSIDPTLNDIAEERAHQIHKNYSHYDSDGNPMLFDDASQHGTSYNTWGENIADNSGFTYNNTVEVANQFNKQWYTDEKGATPAQDGGHRKNILNPNFNYVGVGVYKHGDAYYACEDFSN